MITTSATRLGRPASTFTLCFVDVDGSERIEQFDDEQALVERQRELESTLTHDGWSGPHGWNV